MYTENIQKTSVYNNQIKKGYNEKIFVPLKYERRDENQGKLSQLSKDNQNVLMKQPSISSSCSVMNGLRDPNIYRS